MPYRNDVYHRGRRVIGFGADQVLRLDDEYGFCPALGGLQRLHDQGRVAVIHGVGYPSPNRSHFESMDIWHTADLAAAELADGATGATGWLGRYLDGAPFARAARLPAVSVTRDLPLVLRAGRTPVPAVESPQGYGLGDDPESPMDRQSRRRTLEDLLKRKGDAGSGASALDFLRQASRDAVLSAEEIQRIASEYRTPIEYPATRLAASLKFVAQLLAADLGARLFYVRFDGFDTHAGQDVRHPQLMGELGDAVEAFMKDVAHHRRSDEVGLMMYSEFGRRVEENASAGTDHGAAGPMIFVGGKVKGGLHGTHPDLDDLLDGDLRHTVDFRSVYATVLEDWLGARASTVLGDVAKFEGLFA